MEIRQLRYFVCVADQGSIAAAARALHVAQPALSRQIAALEGELGARLVHRLPRGVALTGAGQELARQAREVLLALKKLTTEVARAAAGGIGSLRIGVMPGYSWLLGSMDEMRRRHPAVRLEVETLLSLEQQEQIKSGKLSAGVMAWRSALDPALSGAKLYTDGFSVAFSRKQLPNFRPRHLKDFAGEKFISFARSQSPSHYDLVARAFAAAGFAPEVSHVASDLPTMVGLVASSRAYAVVPISFRTQCPETVRIARVDGLDLPFDIELVWRTDNDDQILNNFLQLAES